MTRKDYGLQEKSAMSSDPQRAHVHEGRRVNPMKKSRIIQRHHAIYSSPEHPEQEWMLPLFKGEHECASKINLYTRKSVSRGFLKWLLFFVLRNEDRAIDLENVRKEGK